ncbi:hypothetical protein [Kribbella sp.]|nr:hypothetical protein [Kribbella sp.]HZX02774.1 hypothetical protein [Kribbella sp.]
MDRHRLLASEAIARLRVTALPDDEYGMGHRAVFDVVVWSGA